MPAAKRHLSHARLLELERSAAYARQLAEEEASIFSDGEISTLDLVESLGFSAIERPNLCDDRGDRLGGLLEPTPVGGAIYFEAYDPAARQRFSICHELGHVFLHERAPDRVRACQASRVDATPEAGGHDQEVEADAFAAAFLMPAAAFRDATARYGYCAGFLAERFGASLEAVRRRWAALEAKE